MPTVNQPSPPRPSSVAAFGEIDKCAVRRDHEPPDFAAISQDPEFRMLRRKLRGFSFPMAALFLLWYLGYVVIAAFHPEFMAIRVLGNINIGLLMGLGQFVTTVLITVLYRWYASREIDPRARELHLKVTGKEAP